MDETPEATGDSATSSQAVRRERPIIMSGDNPKLILEGRKTQTRRIISRQPQRAIQSGNGTWCDEHLCPLPNSYGVAGDLFWVREKFAWVDRLVDGFEREDPVMVAYSDGTIIRHECGEQQNCSDESWNLEHSSVKWRPSIHMPRWASRITLEITKVRVERLQDISEEDAKAESPPMLPPKDAVSLDKRFIITDRLRYKQLWDTIHGKGAWDKNPWVWVIEFSLSPERNSSRAHVEKIKEDL